MTLSPSIDVVIPTMRVNPDFLEALLSLEVPRQVNWVHYYLVIDAPDHEQSGFISELEYRDDVTVLCNSSNCGAALSRNRGIDEGRGDFVLLLDDDVIASPGLVRAYLRAIAEDDQSSPGYVGVTRFPNPIGASTEGIVASDILTFFSLAEHRVSVPWGVTANLCLRRAALGSIRFSPSFPKSGGGEDIDFCLRLVHQASGIQFRSVPDAVVLHPWWRGGARGYLRFARWSFGDSRLPVLHPRLRYRNSPTLPELLVLVLPLALALGATGIVSIWAVVAFLLAVVVVEFAVDFCKLWLRGQRRLRPSVEGTLVRLANDAGRLVGIMSQGRPWGLLERFDFFGTGESIGYERRVAGAKLVGWVLSVLGAICI